MRKNIVLGLSLGLLCTVFISPYDPWVKERVGTIFKTIFADAFGCTVSGELESFSLLPATVTMRNLTLSSTDPTIKWHWQAQRYTTGFSWMQLFLSGVIDMWVSLDGVRSESGMHQGKPAILPHLKDLMKGPDLLIPLLLKSVHVQHAQFSFDNGLKHNFYWKGHSRKIGDTFRSQFYLTDGSILKENRVESLLEHITGSIAIDAIDQKGKESVAIRLDGRAEIPDLGSYPTCFFAGHWRDGRGRFHLQSIDQSLRVYPLILFEQEDTYQIEASASVPVSYLNKLSSLPDVGASGNCLLQIKGALHSEGDGNLHFICEDVMHALSDKKGIMRGSLTKKRDNVNGTFDYRMDGVHWHGSMVWDALQQYGSCDLTNRSALLNDFLYWYLPPKSAQIHCEYDQQRNFFDSRFAGTALHKIKDTQLDITGSATIHSERFSCTGLVGECPFTVSGSSPKAVDTFQITDDRGRSLACCNYDTTRGYHGAIDLTLMRTVASSLLQFDMQAEGEISFNGRRIANGFDGHVAMNEGTIRLPQTLNFIEQLQADIMFDLNQKRLVAHDVACKLHTGTFSIAHAVVLLDAARGLQFVHLPIVVDHCLFTVKHDLFAMVSGSLLIEKHRAQDLQVRGHLILDRSQLKENLFSNAMQRKLISSSEITRQLPELPMVCDVTIETKEPIRVDTNFLQANAQLYLHARNRLSNPTISGGISVTGGSIIFPYKPLHILHGEITLLPEQPLNPLIEISAKNKIKNHQIALHVSGSLNDHMVFLDATPPLTEEQIVSLLVAGAHEESLQAVIPTLLMQNITNFIFSSHKSNFFDRHIKPWMKQINVHLMPNFTEQSGRGGLRGALEITVNDRWRALIEKNFSLTEDTRFELEYMLSDEVTFRVVRDERSDIGGEVEMKWKF